MNDAGVNLGAVRRVADAVLYEGYILYPYRASSQKNRSRWQFGVVMAPGYAAVDPSESSVAQSEWVLEHSGQPSLQIILRFLQVQRRSTEGSAPAGAWDEVNTTIQSALDDPELAAQERDTPLGHWSLERTSDVICTGAKDCAMSRVE